MKLTKHRIRVIHIPQVPMKGFEVEVRNEYEAVLLEKVLVDQHLFLLENNIIEDYSNIICIETYQNGEWNDYWNEHYDIEWDEFKELYLENKLNDNT